MNSRDDEAFCTLTSAQACSDLGVSAQTLYAYVSRGLLRAVDHPEDARKSLYDRRDIAALRARKRRGRSRRAVAQSTIDWGEPVLASKITRIADGRFYYRGEDAVALSRTAALEDVAVLLAGLDRADLVSGDSVLAVPDGTSPFMRMMRLLTEAAIQTKRRAARKEAGALLRQIAGAAAGKRKVSEGSVHDVLAEAWTADPRAADLIRRALVLCADHELNPSTYAARVAASAGANLASALLAGLATFSGSLHGGIAPHCRAWLDKMSDEGRAAFPAGKAGEPPLLPGFGHPLYPEGDPRAIELMAQCEVPQAWRPILKRVDSQFGLKPNIDFGLALLERQLALPRGASLALFAVGRSVGWIAHVFEQRKTGRIIRPRAF